MKRLIPILMCFSLIAPVSVALHAADLQPAAHKVRFSKQGVTAWVSQSPFEGDSRFFDIGTWKQLAADHLPNSMTGHVTLESKTAIVAVSRDGTTLTFWTRRDQEIVRRGEVKLDAARDSARFKLAVTKTRPGLAVEVYSPDQSRRHTIALSPDGVLQIVQQPGQGVSVLSRMKYLLVPSLVGVDALYSAEDLTRSNPSYVVSLNMAVGLLADHDAMMVAVWPRGKQLARIEGSITGGEPLIGTFSLETAGQSFYLAFIEQPSVWHEENLKSKYLEKDTKISWQRPLEARWIGRFHIESDDYSFPFYFLDEKHHLWGRYIRGWFYYPVWFDRTNTMIHFEKKFPPKGRLLIYYLDTYQDDDGLVSPVGVMESVLGVKQAAKLLDFPGTRERMLLPHGNAVCAMTREIEHYFSSNPDAPPRSLVESYANDVATFIRLIRDRVFEYDRFVSDAQQLLASQKSSNPSLAEALRDIEEILSEMQDIVREDLPNVSLDQVNQWADEMRDSAQQVKKDDLARIKGLAHRCRSVAGSQDEMTRNLSVLAVRLMEQAVRMGTASPQHVRLAEQLIDKTRSVLRQPTWWEVCRRYESKSNPGAP